MYVSVYYLSLSLSPSLLSLFSPTFFSLSLPLPSSFLARVIAGHVWWWLCGLYSSSFIRDGRLPQQWLPRPSPPVPFKQPVCTLWQRQPFSNWNAPSSSSSPAPTSEHDGIQRRRKWVPWSWYSRICWGRYWIGHTLSVYGWISGGYV